MLVSRDEFCESSLVRCYHSPPAGVGGVDQREGKEGTRQGSQSQTQGVSRCKNPKIFYVKNLTDSKIGLYLRSKLG